jgi:hypothetical protein
VSFRLNGHDGNMRDLGTQSIGADAGRTLLHVIEAQYQESVTNKGLQGGVCALMGRSNP